MVLIATRLPKYVFTLTAIVLLLQLTEVSAQAQTRIDHCGTDIRSSGRYVLDRDLDCRESGLGILIEAGNVEVSLAGHRISGKSGSGAKGYGIWIHLVRTGEVGVFGPGSIEGFGSGVFIQHSPGPVTVSEVLCDGSITGFNIIFSTVVFRNNRAIRGGFGFLLIGSNHSMLIGNSSGKNEEAGFYVQGDDNRLIANSAFQNGHDGISVINGMHNEIIDNKARLNEWHDLAEYNPACGTDLWERNFFDTANQSCIH